MVDRHGLSLACVGSRNAPVCPLDDLRHHGNVLVERELAEGAKLLLLSKPTNPTNQASLSTQPQHQSHHHGRARKSSSLDRKRLSSPSSLSESDFSNHKSINNISSGSNSSSNSSSSGGLTPVIARVAHAEPSKVQISSPKPSLPPQHVSSSKITIGRDQPMPPSSQVDEAIRPIRHAHRRSLSTSEHLHFAGKGGPPTLSAAAFQPDDDDDESESNSSTNQRDDNASIVARSKSDDEEDIPAPTLENENDSSSEGSVKPLPPLNQQPQRLPPLKTIILPPPKSAMSRLVSGETIRSLSPNNGSRLGPNSPHLRPRRSSAPDLDSVIENVVSQIDGKSQQQQVLSPSPLALDSPAATSHHGGGGGGGTPSSRASGAESTRSNRSGRRHYRQLSAPMVVGGGVVDVDSGGGDSIAIVASTELKLPDGLVITRSGISSNPSTPERSLLPRRSSALPRVGSAFRLDRTTEDEEDILSGQSSASTKHSVVTSRSGSGQFNSDELEILGCLGRGTAGIVSNALHLTGLRIVAVKSVQIFDALKRETTIAEIQALYKRMIPFSSESASATVNPESESCIVGFYDAFIPENGATVNIVLEWMDGGSLQDLVDRKKAQGKSLPEDFIAIACRRMLRGLCELFDERLLHRDMKPANVLVSRSGAIKLSDFGVSVAFGLGEESNAKTFVGSLSYMAPERVQSSAENSGYSYASDLWGVGLIAYVCATGEYPFTKQFDEDGFWGMVQAVTDEIPPLDSTKYSADLIDFVAKCLRRNPSERPTAQDHLNHPFVQKYIHEPDRARKAVSDQLQPVDQSKAREELNSLLTIATKFYVRQSLRYQSTLPRFSYSKVQNLANQVGVVFTNPEELESLVEMFNSRMLQLGATSPSSVMSGQSFASPTPRVKVVQVQDANNMSAMWKKNNLKLDVN